MFKEKLTSFEPKRDLPSANARAQLRSSMFLAAVLRAGTRQTSVRVRNLSPSGAMIELPVTPSTGSTVELMRGALTAKGLVVWSSTTRCGMRFSDEVSVDDWLAAPTKLQQRRVDEIVALVKAGGADLDPLSGHPSEPRANELLADDLGVIVTLLQDLEHDLATSDKTLKRHGMKLQHLDIAMQMLRAVASELNPNRSEERFAMARLRDLRVACAQALGTA